MGRRRPQVATSLLSSHISTRTTFLPCPLNAHVPRGLDSCCMRERAEKMGVELGCGSGTRASLPCHGQNFPITFAYNGQRFLGEASGQVTAGAFHPHRRVGIGNSVAKESVSQNAAARLVSLDISRTWLVSKIHTQLARVACFSRSRLTRFASPCRCFYKRCGQLFPDYRKMPVFGASRLRRAEYAADELKMRNCEKVSPSAASSRTGLELPSRGSLAIFVLF